MCKQVLLAFVVMTAVCGFAKTSYVDCSLDDYSGHDGSSWDKAYRTIQEAVSNADTDDLILVAPGIYSGATTLSSDGASNVVHITKRITLRSKEGRATRDTTHIVGAHDPEPMDSGLFGMGPKAVRCICVATAGAGTVIEGFTIRDGATRFDSNGDGLNQNRGGGVWMPGNTFVVDCVVSNCVGTRGGAINGGNVVRSLLTDNKASSNGPATRDANIYHSIITRNIGGGSVYANGNDIINCTIVGNAMKPVNGNTDTQLARCYNSVLIHNGIDYGCNSCTHDHGVLMEGYNYSSTVSNSGAAITNDCRHVTYTTLVFVSPVLGDFRSLADSAAAGLGSADNLAKIPEAYRYKDFNGEMIDPSGLFQAGAVQETVTKAYPAIRFNDTLPSSTTKANVTINGVEPMAPNAYVCPTFWPTQYEVTCKTPGGYHLFGLLASGSDTQFRYPGSNGKLILVPPSPGLADLTLTPTLTTRAYWADPENGYDGNAGTEDAPLKTLQGAVDKANATALTYWVIYAKPGYYNEGGAVGPLGITNRVYFTGGARANTVRLVSTEGSDVTFIEGAEDPDSEHDYKLGPAAIRCVGVDCNNCSVTGFTLTGGRCGLGANGEESTDNSHALHGGGVYSTRASFQLLDCVVTNCAASRGAIADGGTLRRCRFIDCTSTWYGAIRKCVASFCTFNRIRTSRGYLNDLIVYSTATTLNCTFFDENVERPFEADIASTNINDLVKGFYSFHNLGPAVFGGTYYDAVTYPSAAEGKTGITAAVIRFADETGSDFRPYSVLAPTLRGTTDFCDFYLYASGDVNGDPIVFDDDGCPLSGAVQTLAASVAVVGEKTASGAGTDGIAPVGTNYLAGADTITFTAIDAATRPFKGFFVNGEFFAASTNLTVSLADFTDGMNVSVAAIYDTFWYVNPNGSDANNGWSTATPKRTLAAVMLGAISGDTVMAAKGYYAEGDVIHNTSLSLRSRVCVPAGVTLKSAEGPEVTFIMGSDGTGSPTPLRCATTTKDSSIVGFTICGGRTFDDSTSNTSDDYNGAGVHGLGWFGLVENCIISNCIAVRGGGIYGSTVSRCRLLENHALNNCSAGRNSRFFNCLFDRNTGGSVAGYWGALVNCTFAADNNATSSILDGTAHVEGVMTTNVANTIFLSGRMKSTVPTRFENCVFVDTFFSTWDASKYTTNEFCAVRSISDLAFDSAYAPIIGINPAVDSADKALYDEDRAGSLDLWGNPRFVNGLKLDIGAVETDWKAKYAQDLRKRDVAVTAASPAVEETIAETVALIDGTSLELTWGNGMSSASKRVRFKVSGGGTLSLSVDEAEAQAFVATGLVQEYVFAPSADPSTLVFSFEGDGFAEIISCQRTDRSVLIIK